MLKSYAFATALCCAAACPVFAPLYAQTTTNLKHQPPDGAILGFQLTDGTVIVQGNQYSDWWKLTPDTTGSYVNGTWKQMASLQSGYAPYAMSSAVLADGRLLITGGEYNNGVFAFTDLGAVYQPTTNTWTPLSPPANWDFIGDSPSTVLANGKFLLGRKFDKRIAELDPATLTWTELKSKGKNDFDAEEGWTLMPNGTVLTYDVKKAPNSEIYSETAQKWTSAGSTVQNLQGPPSIKSIKYGNGLVYYPPGEVGPGILLPNGTVFATGATHKGSNTAHTAIYTPPAGGTGVGTWAAGPDIPNGDQAGDSFAALLPTGNVLLEGDSGTLYEFNGTSFTTTKFNGQGGFLMVLPTGEILVNGGFVYQASGTVNPAWAPTITNVPTTLTRGSTYEIQGTQFNGLSQANSFGDELQTATNYPLVRITNTASGQVIYARTHDHSTMGVATGSTIVSTNFDVPSSAQAGASTLVVVANGIPSAAVSVTLQ